MELCSSACSEKVNLRIYPASVLAKYDVGSIIMGSNYHAHLKYFGIINGVVFGIKKMCKFLFFKYVFDFAMGPLLFKLFYFKVVKGLFGHPVVCCEKLKEFEGKCLEVYDHYYWSHIRDENLF